MCWLGLRQWGPDAKQGSAVARRNLGDTTDIYLLVKLTDVKGCVASSGMECQCGWGGARSPGFTPVYWPQQMMKTDFRTRFRFLPPLLGQTVVTCCDVGAMSLGGRGGRGRVGGRGDGDGSGLRSAIRQTRAV